MGYVKLTHGKYSSEQDMVRLMDYLTNPFKCPNMFFGSKNLLIDMGLFDTVFVTEQFYAVQYKRVTPSSPKRFFHVVVSMDMLIEGSNNYGYRMREEDIFQKNVKFLMALGNRILSMYPDYQSFFIIHENTNNLHMHIVFNNCAILPKKENLTYHFNLPAIQNMVELYVDYELGVR